MNMNQTSPGRTLTVQVTVSSIFPSNEKEDAMSLSKITDELVALSLRFSEPVTHVYNPLIYAHQGLGSMNVMGDA